MGFINTILFKSCQTYKFETDKSIILKSGSSLHLPEKADWGNNRQSNIYPLITAYFYTGVRG